MQQIISFASDTWIYVARMREFTIKDWIVYLLWIGMIGSLFVLTTAFLYLGWSQGVRFPGYVWNISLGAFIFTAAIAVDTIGHRTIYKEAILKGENMVHHITIFAGITSVLGLCLSYDHAGFFQIPSLVLIVLSFVYSLIDEAMHWQRYLNGQSDRIEMWSHFFILLGHSIMVLAWWKWLTDGYPGVKETLVLLGL